MTQNHSKGKLQGVIRMSIKRAAGDIILLYRLTEEPLPPNQFHHTAKYSLTVTKVDAGGTRREVRNLPDLTRSRAEAERIFDLISRGLVTPYTLDEVIDDLFAI